MILWLWMEVLWTGLRNLSYWMWMCLVINQVKINANTFLGMLSIKKSFSFICILFRVLHTKLNILFQYLVANLLCEWMLFWKSTFTISFVLLILLGWKPWKSAIFYLFNLDLAGMRNMTHICIFITFLVRNTRNWGWDEGITIWNKTPEIHKIKLQYITS